jgi:Asp/Glu/hydantoin racemase
VDGDPMTQTPTEPRSVTDVASRAKYRFLFIQPFRIADDSEFLTWSVSGSREERLMNYENLELGRLLEDVDWEIHPGPKAPYGDWPVENREEFALVAAARLPIVKEAAESGDWDALILLGGGEPGAHAAREIGRKHGVAVTSCATSQFHVAAMLGHRFSVIDLADSHSMYYYGLILENRMGDRCASIRLIDYPLGRPGADDEGRSLAAEKEKALAGERSEGVEAAVDAAESAIEQDGAEVITFACSGTFWLQPFVRQGLLDRGWDVPVLEGYSTAIAQAKLMVDLGVDASALMYPGDRPVRVRSRKIF